MTCPSFLLVLNAIAKRENDNNTSIKAPICPQERLHGKTRGNTNISAEAVRRAFLCDYEVFPSKKCEYRQP